MTEASLMGAKIGRFLTPSVFVEPPACRRACIKRLIEKQHEGLSRRWIAGRVERKCRWILIEFVPGHTHWRRHGRAKQDQASADDGTRLSCYGTESLARRDRWQLDVPTALHR